LDFSNSVQFGFQSQVLGFGFFSVSVFAHHRNARVILVCENTKTESINFDKKFQLKHIDWPRLVWRSYSSHSVSSTPSHSAWLVCLSICHSSELINNGSTDRLAVWVEDAGGPKISYTSGKPPVGRLQ